MHDIDFAELTNYAKIFSGLTPEREALLVEAGDQIKPHLKQITENFYSVLETIPKARPFLEGRLENLKKTHHQWMEGLFTGPFDENFVRHMYHVGDVHVRVDLPVEFMAGGTTLIADGIIKMTNELYADDPQRRDALVEAINSILGMSLMVMQQSYQASVDEALEKFLAITGMSRALFEKLAETYNVSRPGKK